MKRILSIFMVLTLLLTALLPLTAYAEGEGNIDHGSGDIGGGTGENFWNTGDEGVRVTVVRTRYQTYWRLLEQTGSGYNTQFEFARNRYSTYNRRTHFTPIWLPDGSYTPYTYLMDCWTPQGMLSMNLTDSVTISGNLWSDWHIAPVKP